jgi:hypothetical protein
VYADTPYGKNVSYAGYLPPVPSYDLMPLEIKAPPYLTYSISSGALFPIGVTPVTVTAKDYVGNVSTCTFNVTVLLPRASNVAFSQRKDGSGKVDICYDLVDTFNLALAGTFNMALAVSLDGGTTFSSLTSISGSVGAGVTGGTCKSIQWDALKDYPNFGSSSVVMRVTRLLDGVGGGAFAPIPGGTYSVGNVVGDSDIIDAGTVSVTLSDYYMSVRDTTKAQWEAVRLWAGTAGLG